MGPKKEKDLTAGENYWRICIEDAPLDEETWKVKVVIIEAAGSDQDRIYINKFETFAAEEKRFVIKNICKTETTFMINQLGGEKKVKDDNLRVFEEGQAYLKDKKDIPPDVLALIIKHLILKMKDEYLFIQRQRLEVKEGMRIESATMIDRAEVRGTVCKPPEVEPPPPPSKGKGKAAPDPPKSAEPDEGKKYNTQLRVRGEEWRDKVYVDDFPQDGPNLYVAVTGFVDPFLPACLVKIGIPLTAIIQVRIDASSARVPSSLLRPTKRGQSQTEILAEKSFNFWENLEHLRIHRESAAFLKDTAFVVFSPPYWDSESISGNSDKIYDELCFLMYDIQDLSRQHLHYLDNLGVIDIPEDSIGDKCFKYYIKQIQDLPFECVTIYSLLDSVLRTVTNRLEVGDKSSETSLATTMIDNKLRTVEQEEKVVRAEHLVSNIFNAVCQTEEHKKSYRITYGEEFENQKDPIVVQFGDIAKYTTFHMRNINLDNIVWTSLLGMPFNNLWNNQNKAEGENEAKINFHINVLLSCFEREDVETAELDRLIHILACRKLYNNRSSLKKAHIDPSTIKKFKKVYLKRSILAEPLPCRPPLSRIPSSTHSFPTMTRSENMSNISYGDDPETSRIKCLFDCPDISELVSAAEIANGKPIAHIIDEFECFEDYSGVCAFQILLEAFNKFNCLDYKYCHVTDCFLVMFFNSHDKDGIAREDWRCHIPTPLCLQDFFDYVLEEHFEWIQNEDKIFDGKVNFGAQSLCKDVINPSAEKSCVENIDVALELIIEGSLKHQELAKIEEPIPESIDDTITTSKKTATTPTSVKSDDVKSGKKTKSSRGSTPKNVGQSFMAPVSDSNVSAQIPSKLFIGYNLGNRRVEVFGQNSTYFSKDGTRVISKYTLTIPSNLEYIILNVIPGNNVNEFWMHRAIDEYASPEILDMCESFRISSKDDVLIYIKKQNYQIPILLMRPSFDNDVKIKDHIMKSTTEAVIDDTLQMLNTKYYHSLLITLPNGLITETVYLDNSPDISHIKQFFMSPLSQVDEEMRCISLNGEVIIFRPSGIIEVLQSDGTFIKIINYGKRVIQKETPHDIQSETSSDKSKKGKGKEKEKGKEKDKNKDKVSPRISETKPPEYELFINEFESIESNGLRQKWTNGIPCTIEKLLIRTATDYCLQEIFSRRMDGTNILLNKDGIQVVTFPNGTRIITQFIIEPDEIYPEWTDEEKEYLDILDMDLKDTDTMKSKISFSVKSSNISCSKIKEEEQINEIERNDGYISVQVIYTVEHENFTSVTIDKSSGSIKVDSPNKTEVVVDTKNNYKFKLDSATNATFDGQTLFIDYLACEECCSKTTASVTVIRDEISSVTKMHQNWMKMKDSFGKKIIVNEEGHIFIHEETSSAHSEEVANVEDGPVESASENRNDTKSETSIIHGKCREVYQAKNMRFFVLNRDLTCSELIHRALLEQYKTNCRWQPWCSINHYDTFGDHRTLLSILTPVHLTETEKWLMDSKLANKPKHLTFKDLKKDPGKGFYHWMRPYERFQPKPIKPDNVLPPRLPRAFILRTLEQQWKESERQELKGAKELLTAILRYRQVMESDCETLLHNPIRDDRTDSERRTDEIIQALGHRIYEDLKARLAEDVESRVKVSITTKPVPVSTEMSVEEEGEEDDSSKQRRLEEERESVVKELEEAEELSPEMKRYWRRRAEEYKEEQFYKYLLRENNVPPYFQNVLGGAIWWDMNDAAGEAVTKAERKKMKCVCAEEATTHTDDTAPYM